MNAAKNLRNALGKFPTGVAIVTAVDKNGSPIGMTINSFSSVSLSPPIILWSISVETASYFSFTRATHFAINILAADQKELSAVFAKPSDDKFAGVDYSLGEDGIPLLKDCAAQFECELYGRSIVGDHEVILGKVNNYRYYDLPPLGFESGSYKKLADHS